MALSIGTAERWIRATLIGDTTITDAISTRIYPQAAVPQGAPTPYVIYQYMGGSALSVVGKTRFWNDDLWLVKCVGKATQQPTIETVMNRVDALLDYASGVNSQGTVVVAEHERPIQYAESDAEGTTYLHLGAEYRLKVQAGVTA